MDIKEKRDFILKMIIAICSGLTFLTILIVAIVVAPKAVKLMNTAQRTMNNMELVSEYLKSLELAEAIKIIEGDTTQAMNDVSSAMEQIDRLDIETLNQSIFDLSESVDEFKKLLGK